jgi:hypothetical protein
MTTTTHRVSVTFDPAAPSTRNARLSAASDQEGAAPTRILGTAFAVGAPSGPSSDGHRYQFNSMPDNADELLDVVNEHDGWADPIGRLAEPLALAAEGDQLVAANARIFGTTAGRDALVLAAEGVKGGWSIAATFSDYTEDEQGVRHVQDPWSAIHLGLVRSPAFTESEGLTLAASAASTREGAPAMPPEAATTTPPPAAPAGQFAELPTVAELAAQVAEFNRQAGQAQVHPLAQFSSHQEFAAAFIGADEDERQRLAAAFAIPTTTTADMPGLLIPTWRTQILTNLDARRPAIQAFGGSIGLPDTGMDVKWPYFDGDLDALIARQLLELDELNGVKLTIKDGGASIRTAGAASTMSYQAILRSSPSYLAQWQTIMEAAWARYTEAQFETELAAKATDMGGASLPAIAADVKPTAFKRLLFDASAQVEDATGAPADVVLVAADVWSELGGSDLPNPKEGNTGNGVGTSDASTLSISVNGLQPKRAPFLAAGEVIVSNSNAAKFSEQGPMLATQDDVTKLGRDVAVWGMYVPAEVYYPAGVLRYRRSA